MTVRKAVIPAAGLGTRFLPATKAQPKEMLPVVDKPVIQYVVEEAVRAGIDDILIITGRSKRSLEDHFDRNGDLESELAAKGNFAAVDQIVALSELADIHFVRQSEPLGLGHAVGRARKHVGDNPFVVMLADDIIHQSNPLLERMIDTFDRLHSSVIACMAIDDPSAYGVITPEPVGDGLVKLLGVVEKPPREEAPSHLAIMGRYVFTPRIFDMIDQVEPGKGGEIQLTDAIMLLLAEQDVYGAVFSGGRFDTGNKLDYLRAVVELASERPDLGPQFKSWLVDFVRAQGLV
jgi:UTP--glucose-1-phosphate uridylyltransferase